jgi:hypothetical protein
MALTAIARSSVEAASNRPLSKQLERPRLRPMQPSTNAIHQWEKTQRSLGATAER